MEYNEEFFCDRKEVSQDIRYRFLLISSFYSVYSNGYGDYHMPKEDEKSLRERIYFYEKIIDKENYPVYTKSGIYRERNPKREVLHQILGLPMELLVDEDGREIQTEEILSRIHFEEDIYREKARKYDLDDSILESEGPIPTQLINYLIENGFYLLNPERVLNFNNLDDSKYYPFYIDERKIEEDENYEMETAHKLIMDFDSISHVITADVFQTYYAPLDSLSLCKKAEMAFFEKTSGDDIYAKSRNLNLKRYFYSLAIQVINRFFRKWHSVRGLAGFTILDHDFETWQTQERFIYLGVRVDMYCTQYRHFEKMGDGTIRQTYSPMNYVFDASRKKDIRRLFDLTKKYMKKNATMRYVPSVFLKIMGLPYPAFLKAQYFDFENGDADSFLKLFDFYHDIEFDQYGLLLTLVTSYGRQISVKDDNENSILYYLKKKKNLSFLVSNPHAFFDVYDNLTLFSFDEKKDSVLSKIVQGDSMTYRELFDAFHSRFNLSSSYLSIPMEDVKAFFVKYEKNGILTPFKDFFSKLQEGESNLMATLQVTNQYQIKQYLISVILMMVLSNHFLGVAKRYIDHLSKSGKGILLANQGEVFYDCYHPYPTIVKGRFLYFYPVDENTILIDEEDSPLFEKAIAVLLSSIDESRSFPYSIKAFGREIIDYADIHDSDAFGEFLGIPKNLLGNLSFAEFCTKIRVMDGLSFYHRPDHRKLLKEDESLYHPLILSSLLRRGIYLVGTDGGKTMILKDKTHDDPIMEYYTKESVIRYYCFEQKNLSTSEEQRKKYIEYGKMSSSMLKKNFIDVLFDKGVGEMESIDIPLLFGGDLSKALYQAAYLELFPEQTKDYRYLLSYRQGDYFVAAGINFNGFSLDGKIGSFCFAKEDAISFVTAWNHLPLAKGINERNQKYQIVQALSCLGIPIVMVDSLYEILKKKKGMLSLEDIPYLEIPSMPLEYGYDDFFSMKKENRKRMIEAASLYQTLRRKGLFCYLDYEFEMDRKTMKSTINGRKYYILDQVESIVKDLIFPTEIEFMNQIDLFIDTFDRNELGTEKFLFYLKEFLIFSYRNNPYFIKDVINQCQLSSGKNDSAIEKSFSSFRLPPFEKDIGPYELKNATIDFITEIENKIIEEQSSLFLIDEEGK